MVQNREKTSGIVSFMLTGTISYSTNLSISRVVDERTKQPGWKANRGWVHGGKTVVNAKETSLPNFRAVTHRSERKAQYCIVKIIRNQRRLAPAAFNRPARAAEGNLCVTPFSPGHQECTTRAASASVQWWEIDAFFRSPSILFA